MGYGKVIVLKNIQDDAGMKRSSFFIASILTILISSAAAETPSLLPLANEPIAPIPLEHGQDPKLAMLGKKLFHDPRLSGDGSVACATCHSLALGGTDHRRHSIGIHGAEGQINAPTVFNSSNNFIQFWDGRSATLEEQGIQPIQNPKEMGSTISAVIGMLNSDEAYRQAFQEIFEAAPSIDTMMTAIATYERTLITPDAPIDRYLRGETSALSAEAQRGYQLFKMYGCVSCHQGRNIGGNMFQKFGIMVDYFADRGNVTDIDMGRFNVTHNEADRHVFKVPSLRNVELTPPYFHDGTANTLEDAVRVMAKYQLGRTLNDDEIRSIVAFLRSLTGRQPT